MGGRAECRIKNTDYRIQITEHRKQKAKAKSKIQMDDEPAR